ncbi:hypothetical protein CBS101457_006853 [Exobasidium rhododendri]|nr:hypothetical protein CBS101457_006853 [Exobasidium rhododendri]
MGSIPTEQIAALKQPFGHIINGKLVTKSEKTIDVINPSTEEVIASVPVATQATLDETVDAARKAFKPWSKTTWKERGDRVRAWGETFEAETPELAKLLTTEQGKSMGVSMHEFGDILRWFKDMPDMELKDEIILENNSKKVIKTYSPLGVCAGIVPWNFPVVLMMFKIIPGLLTGNCVIIKPSPFTPLCDIRIIQGAQKHFPPGVLQCIVGDDSLGPMITSHPGIDKIGFTGSTVTGRLVAKSCAATLKRMTLELGGNDPSIVLPDVDVDSVAPQVTMAASINSAQFCCASKRIYVHEDIYEKFTTAMANAAKGMKVGNGLEEDTVHGPINNKMQFDKVAEYFKDSTDQGHKFLTGGKIEKGGKGFFVPVTIVDNPPEDSRIVQEEPFGPIFPVLKWKDEEEMLERVNDTQWGLGASVWGKNEADVERIARGIESGTVWCNSMQAYDPQVPFGGWKQSGSSHESGIEGLIAYTNIRVISLTHNK